MTKVSLVIVAYKNGETLLKCLKSIGQYNDIGKELEVIVIDNSPNESSIKKYVQDSLLTKVRYVKAQNNGYGASNNIGARIATGKIIGFINPDIIFIEPVIKSIYSAMVDGKNAWMSCKLLDESGRRNYSFFYDYEDNILKKIFNYICIKFDYYNSSYMFLSGSNIFINRNVFIKSGAFDENIFMYYEEYDLKKRIQKTFPERRIVFNKGLHLIHLEGRKNINIPNTFKLEKELESAKYIAEKYHLNYEKKIKHMIFVLKVKKSLYGLINKKEAIECSRLVALLGEKLQIKP